MRIKDLSCVGIKLHCYSLRVDHKEEIFHDTHLHKDPFFDPFHLWLKKHFDYVLVGDEVSDPPCSQPHWQCICFRKTEYREKEIRDLRYKIKTASWLDNTRKQPFSLRKSTSPLGLFKYCQKDGSVLTNLPEKLFKEIARLAEKYYIKPRAEILNDCAARATAYLALKTSYHVDPFKLFCEFIYGALQDGVILNMPRKTEVWTYALKHRLINPADYYEEFYKGREK